MSVDFSGAIYFSPHGYWMTAAMWFFVVMHLEEPVDINMKERGYIIYGSDIYERTTGIKIDCINGTADGHFYDGEFTL